MREDRSMSWASRELDHANLGDRRRNRRLVKIVEDLAASPESSVPLASRDRAALQGMYDFWANPRIKAASILDAHVWSAVHRSSFEQAQRLLRWYSYRWLIELNQSQYPYKRDWEGGTWATPAVRIG